MASGGRFVYLVYEAGNFRLALDMSLDLRARGVGEPVLFSPYYLPDTPRYLVEARRQGIAYVHESTALGGYADPIAQLGAGPASGCEAPKLERRPGVRARLATRAALADLARIQEWERHCDSRHAAAYAFLRAAGARALLLPEDNVERDSACWIRAMRALGGRSIVVSYGAMNPLEAAIAYHDNPEHTVRTRADRAFAALFPRWSTRYRGRRMLRLPTPRALALERLRLAPANPWIVNGGDVDAVVVESEYMKARFVRHGIAARKVHPIGHASLDELARATGHREEIRAAWRAAHGYDGARPVLLCAMPPDQYPRLPAPEFPTYEELVDGWLAALRALETHFPAVSPHPNLAPAIRERIRAAGVALLEGGVAQWLPACDVYAASVSGTIKWALACGKPVVNYDCYRYGHDDFFGIPTVAHPATYPEFVLELMRFGNARHAARMAQEAQRGRERYGVLDGNAGERIAQLVRGEP